MIKPNVKASRSGDVSNKLLPDQNAELLAGLTLEQAADRPSRQKVRKKGEMLEQDAAVESSVLEAPGELFVADARNAGGGELGFGDSGASGSGMGGGVEVAQLASGGTATGGDYLYAQADTTAGAAPSGTASSAAPAAGAQAGTTAVAGGVAAAGTAGTLVVAAGALAVAASGGSGGTTAVAAVASALTGSVIDGYLRGATVFIDSDDDGVLDAGEPSTTTDANGDFTFPAGTTGKLVAFGGTDISTGLPFAGILKAPEGATVVTPLTTLMADLVSAGSTVANAEQAVLASLGLGALDASVNLLTFDPIEAAGGSNATLAAAGLQIQKAGVTVATLVSSLTEKVLDATGADASSGDDVARDIFAKLSAQLSDGALTGANIGVLTGALVDDVLVGNTLGGVDISAVKADILAGKTALAESTQGLVEALQDADNAGEIGSVQKASMTSVKLLSASVDGLGDVVTLYFDRQLDTENVPTVSQFEVENGGARTISSLQVVNNQVILKMSTSLDASHPVKVSFADTASSNDSATVQDRDGVDAQSFHDVVVETRLSQTASESEAFAHASTLNLGGAEISAFDPGSDRLFVTSSSAGLQVVSVGADLSLTLLGTVTLGSNDINSVAVKNGIVAVAVAASDKTQPGTVYFLDADAAVGSGMILGSVQVGALPDMVTFSADGKMLLVANEAEQNTAGVNPEGSVSIIDLSAGVAGATVTTASFGAFNDKVMQLKEAGVRLFAGEVGFESVTVAQDLEPEYISIAPDGKTAFVTLQENNAIGILDIAAGQFTDIVPLGLKSFMGLPFDGSDRDGAGNTTAINLQTDNPVYGQYMPDSIASFTGADGKTYYVIANEGDDRDDFITPDETARVSALNLDDAGFPNEAALKTNAEIGRLTVSNAPGNNGDIDGDGDIDRILAYGARSFSILNEDGVIVFDSGSHIEQFVAAGGAFTNATGSGLFDDTRSDNKGPEPEGLTVGKVGDKTLAFVALERGGGGVMVYDVTDPAEVSFVQYLRRAGDESPEGVTFISAADSPSGEDILIVAHEVSNTISIYENRPFTLQLLHFADGEAGLLASSTAPKLAALVDAFEDDYVNSITLAGGDNFLPGPFLAAGTDASLIDEINAVSGSTLAVNATVPIGAVDILMHNLMGVQASAIGNHEFDLGSNVFQASFTPAGGYVGANFPYLSSNLDFSGDGVLNARFTNTTATAGLEEASSLKGRIAPSAVITEGGEKIGLVGATTQILEAISSPSGTEVKGFPTGPGANGELDDMTLLAAQLQPVIDDLIAQGVNKVILMAHLQVIANEKLLATKLSGVDIILAAGSNTRLGDANDQAVAFPGHAASFADTYPLVVKDKDGHNTLIVNTDNEYTYLGRLVVDFDAAGHIVVSSLVANSTLNGAYAATDANVAAAWEVSETSLATTAFADGTRGDTVQTLTDAVQSVISVKDGNVYGYSNVYLEGERSQVRSEETNLGSLSADANAYAAELAMGAAAAADTYIVSLKNGGGIRAQIGTLSAPDPVDGTVDKLPPPDGSVSQLDVENSLRFNNQLMIFDTTPEGLKAILEHGVAAGTLQGRFPQIGGVAFSWDPDFTSGARVSDIALIGDGYRVNLYDNGVKLDSAPASISVVTLSFTANGGDNYPIKANAENFRYITVQGDGSYALSTAVDESMNFTLAASVPGAATVVGEQSAFETYMKAFHATAESAYNQADTQASQDERIQNLNLRAEDVLGDAAPMLVSTSPADDASGVTSHHIILTFDENVVAGSGNIVISGSNGSETDTRTIAVGDVTQVTISGNTVDINPGADLLNGYAYNVQFASGVIQDTAGNAFAGITTPTALNFTRAVPGVSTLLITEVNSNADGGDFFEIFNYGATAVDLTGWKWDDNSASFTDAAAASFASGTTIAAGGRLIVATAVADPAALKTAWGLGSDVPVVALGGPGLGGGDAVVLFNASGHVVTSFNYSGTTITASDSSTIAPSAAASGVTFTVGHAGLAFGGSAQTSAVWDGASTLSPAYKAAVAGVNGGFTQPAIATTVGSPGIVTGSSGPDTTAPGLTMASPSDNATAVAVANNLVLTFNEAVKAGSGNFVITNAADAGDTRTISVTDATQVSFSGPIVTINPATNLQFGASYSVTFAAGVVEDLAGNDHAGVTSATALNFTTGTQPLPSVLISEVNSNATGGDFFEIYNHGTTTVDLSGWKWDDDSAAFTDATAAIFASGTTIAAGGRLVVVGGTTDTTAFKTAWGLGSETAVVAVGGPGLGSGDAVVLFNATGATVASFNYSGTAKTASDGSTIAPSAAAPGVTFASGHAGAAFGGTATTSAVWDGVSISAPAYKSAAVGVNGAFAQPSTATNIGSPGETFGDIAMPTLEFTVPGNSFDLANYTLAGRFSLPVNPAGPNKLAHEASGVTYNPDTDTLFVVGDGGTSVAQVTRQGVLVDSMQLATGSSPQGTFFYDSEGIAYIGGGKFVFVEERDREFNEFTYVAGGTLGGDSGVRTVKLGTTIGNVGIEGMSFDPLTGGFIAVKEATPLGIFQTTVDFAAGTASNGSPTTDNSSNLFDPALTGLSTHNDVFALSNILSSSAPGYSHLVVLSAPDGKVVMVDRTGKVVGSLAVGIAAKNEGITMDGAGNIYIVGEEGGGNIDTPELLVYSPTPNQNAVGLGSNLYLTFNQLVFAGSGNIVVSDGAGDTRTIAVGDSSQVSFNGSTVTVNPVAALALGKTYTVTYDAGVFLDGHGVSVAALTGSTLGFSTTANVDSLAPQLSMASPSDDATAVAVANNLVLTFNEAVKAGSGNFVIANAADAGDTRTISVTDATQVSFSGAGVTINPAANLQFGASYSVTFAAGVIEDLAGNDHAGVASATVLNFTTATAPAGPAPTILISEMNSNSAGGDFFEIFNYGTTTVDLSGWKWDDDSASFADAGVATFAAGTTIAAGERLLVVGGTADPSAFKTAWGLGSDVAVVAIGGPGFGSGDAVVLFNAAGGVVTSFNYSGTNKTASDGSTVAPSAAAPGVTFTVGHAGLAFGGTATTSAVWDGESTSTPAYKAAAVGVSGGFAQPTSAANIGSPGVVTGSSTPDTTAPQLGSSSPADDATGVAVANNLVLTFNEAVKAGSGNFVITNVADSGDTRTVSVTDGTQVSFNGAIVTINPAANLQIGTSYSLTFAPGVVEDLAGNDHAGIASTTVLNFTTAVPSGPAPRLLISEVNSNAAPGDFFELYNYGSTAVDLGGWKWDDDSASFTDAASATFASGTTIAAGGRLVVAGAVTDVVPFKTAWGLGSDVQAVAVGGPGLGGGDAIVLFDSSGAVITSFNYSGTNKTASDGSTIAPSAAAPGVTFASGHAGLAFGGTATTSAVWDGVSTSAPAYKSAAVGVNGGFAQAGNAANIGSPGELANPDALAVGDVLFLGANGDTTDAFAFLLTRSINVSTEIGFTDRNYSDANQFTGITNESAFIWTADRNYAAGTVVTVQPDGVNPVADKGLVLGAGGGLSTTAETIYAFQGSIDALLSGSAGGITVDRLLASLNVGGAAAGDVPSAIAGVSLSFTQDNAKYSGSLDTSDITALAALVANAGNWTTSDTTAFSLTNGSLF